MTCQELWTEEFRGMMQKGHGFHLYFTIMEKYKRNKKKKKKKHLSSTRPKLNSEMNNPYVQDHQQKKIYSFYKQH